MFEQSAIPVNCSHILIFLKHLACYTINPDTHQWYRINGCEIKESHNVAICNDKTVNMVELQPAEPPEANTIETFARLTTINNNTNLDQISNNTNGNPPQNNMSLLDNQSCIIIDKFSLLTEELKISPDLSQATYQKWLKLTKLCKNRQENSLKIQHHRW